MHCSLFYSVYSSKHILSRTSIELVEVSGREGNDAITVFSTQSDEVLHLFGGIGSDQFDITPANLDDLLWRGQTYEFPPRPSVLTAIQGVLSIYGALIFYLPPTYYSLVLPSGESSLP